MTDPGRQTLMDRFLAWALGVCVAVLAYFTGNSLELPPELWDDLAVAAGLRPPAGEFPALWWISLSFLIDNFGIAACIEGLKILGPVSLGLLTVMTHRLFTGLLPEVMKDGCIANRRGRWISRSIVATGAVLFVCSEPVWLAGCAVSPEMAAVLITEAVLLAALSAFEHSSRLGMILAGAVCGVLAAETPIAFVILVVCWCRLYFKHRPKWAEDGLPLSNPVVFIVTSRRMVYAFLLCWMCTVALNLSFYRACGGGGEENGAFIAIVKYFLNYPAVLMDATTPIGWGLIFAVVIAPAVVLVVRSKSYADTSKILPLSAVCFAAFAGVFSCLQSSGFSGFHFWKWHSESSISAYPLCLSMLVIAAVAVKSLSVLAVEIYFRNNARLLREIFPYGTATAPLALRTLASVKRLGGMLRLPAYTVPLILLASVIPFRFDGTVIRTAAVVNDTVYAVSDECDGATMLFTDGSLDAAVEVVCAAKGCHVKALSLMSGPGSYDVALRLRGETEARNMELLKKGAAEALKSWVYEDNQCMSNIAVQVGLELWRNGAMHKLQLGGFTARTVFRDESEVAKSIEKAHEIAGRIISLYEKPDFGDCGYPELDRLFVCAQWRLARMCMMRADKAERSKEFAMAAEEKSLAQRLDSLNPEWRKVREKIDETMERRGLRLTPREGVGLGLRRKDFYMAGYYAERIIEENPNDMQANFALAMKCFVEQNYTGAEPYLERCLISAPNEPTILNNLAVVQLRLGSLDKAEANAVKALDLFPESKEIKTTLRHIRDAKKEVE